MNTDKFNQVIARADRVMAQLDQRGGPAQAAAKRERQRVNEDLKRRATRVGGNPVGANGMRRYNCAAT